MNAQVETILESSVDLALAEQALKLAKRRQKWAACRDFYAPIIAAFQRAGCEPYMEDSYIVVLMTGDKRKLETAFRILRGAGFTFSSAERPKKGNSQWFSFFNHPECETALFFQFTSSVCRRVKVGTKMVEQDVYETQCGDLLVDETPALAMVESAGEIPF